MLTHGRRAVLVAAVLGGSAACLDFEREHEAFCQRNTRLCGGAAVPPEFVAASHSRYVREEGDVTLRVDAREVYGLGLRFEWTANVGTLSGQLDSGVSSGVSSGVRWTAPACIAGGLTPTVTVRVTHGGGGTASLQFHIPGVKTCPRWLSARGMKEARAGHTATVLPSGRVLVAGGAAAQGPLHGAELYDAATGSWFDTAPMRRAREGHTAAVLPSGQVLVLGGSVTEAEAYEPRTGTWADAQPPGELPEPPAGPLPLPDEVLRGAEWRRAGHAETVLPSGLVLVTGGKGHRGQGGATVLASAEVYDAGVGTWTNACDVHPPWVASTLTVLPSQEVLVTGGDLSDQPSTSAQRYNPLTGTCLQSAGMAIPRRGHTATLLPSGRVLVAGGPNVSPEVYSPLTDTWSLSSSISTPRERHTATWLPTNEVLLVGGRSPRGLLATAERYDVKRDKWLSIGGMSQAREDHTATLVIRDGVEKVLVVGGRGQGGNPLATAELFDPGTCRWSGTGRLKHARALHTATVLLTGEVLVVGGEGGASGPLATAELYDPETGQWRDALPMAQARARHTATLLPTNAVLVVGGQGAGGAPADSELYDPVLGRWTPATRPVMPRVGHQAGVLPSGRVLVTGGTGLPADSTEIPDWEVYSP